MDRERGQGNLPPSGEHGGLSGSSLWWRRGEKSSKGEEGGDQTSVGPVEHRVQAGVT